ncbi:hypothetical protein GWI33_015157 [Rhynchophorus ferrugineus]|uniref:RecA family profile 1 domain-containing protein n=1 Tax=Rhynchophorus ferrugineus TaxID=354439 RepID=A0A834I3T2_RHYFE|nr:hypothetical protein GWI33_015157 [Rhynchophorus ferrugineus]
MNIIKAFLRSDNNIYFLDSRQKLSTKTLKKLLNNEFKDKCLHVMNKLLIKRIHDKYEIISALFDIKNELDNNANTVRLVIIDSLPTLFLTSADNTENNNILNHLANILRYLANKHHVAIIVNNLITIWAEGDISAINNIHERIACGKYWKTVPNFRIKLKKLRQSIEICLVKSNVIQNQKHCSVEMNELSK